MSTAEIIAELPSLTDSERQQIWHALADLEENDEDTGLCNASAQTGAAMLDALEAEDDAAGEPSGQVKAEQVIARMANVKWIGPNADTLMEQTRSEIWSR
jgi:hypothetical protein